MVFDKKAPLMIDHNHLFCYSFRVYTDLPESEAAELQNKLEELNCIMDQEVGGSIPDKHLIMLAEHQ